ncbi:MAG: PAS domain S-box protein, partial [Bacteriovorax sp.]|nr:PAS domain S-box protein [Bacteriovorax sp.]
MAALKAVINQSNEVELNSIYQALNSVQIIIEHNLDGLITSVNDNFFKIFGYSLDEVRGKHHRILCTDEFLSDGHFQEFWKKILS